MLPLESHAEENPYAAPQASLQSSNSNGEHWRTPRARTHYFTSAFRITVVLSIIATLWAGIGLLIAGHEQGQWKQLFAIGFLAIYLFMIFLLVLMVLCSFVVGLDLILQHLGLRSPPPPSSATRGYQPVEPDALFFTELANQDLKSTADKFPS